MIMADQEGEGRVKGHSFLIENILNRDDNKTNKHRQNVISSSHDDCIDRINSLSTSPENCFSRISTSSSSIGDCPENRIPTAACRTPGDYASKISDMQGTCSCSEEDSTSPECHLKLRHKKKTRTVFSRHQIFYLESAFEMKRYLSSTERSEMARTLKLTETQVKVWFQNRRNKWKSQVNGHDSYSPETSLYPAYNAFPSDPRISHRLSMLNPFYF